MRTAMVFAALVCLLPVANVLGQEAPDRSAENANLDRLVGHWKGEVAFAPVEGEKQKAKGTLHGAWSPGGSFMVLSENFGTGERLTVLGHDRDSKTYKGFMTGSPKNEEVDGSWNDKQQTLSLEMNGLELEYDLSLKDAISIKGTVRANAQVVGTISGKLVRYSPKSQPGKSNNRIEFRIAETEPGKGLTEIEDPETGKKYYLHSEPVIDDTGILNAEVVKEETTQTPALQLEFTPKASRQLERDTRANLGKAMVVLIDGKARMAPKILVPLSQKVMLTGDFTEDELEKLAEALLQD